VSKESRRQAEGYPKEEYMDEIVKKVKDAAPTSATPTGPPGSLDREIRLRVQATTLGRQKKRAEVWSEVSGQSAGSRWAIQCDEGTRVGGDDTAPPPLAYFSAGLAF
jgi:hypothetical protein